MTRIETLATAINTAGKDAWMPLVWAWFLSGALPLRADTTDDECRFMLAAPIIWG